MSLWSLKSSLEECSKLPADVGPTAKYLCAWKHSGSSPPYVGRATPPVSFALLCTIPPHSLSTYTRAEPPNLFVSGCTLPSFPALLCPFPVAKRPQVHIEGSTACESPSRVRGGTQAENVFLYVCSWKGSLISADNSFAMMANSIYLLFYRIFCCNVSCTCSSWWHHWHLPFALYPISRLSPLVCDNKTEPCPLLAWFVMLRLAIDLPQFVYRMRVGRLKMREWKMRDRQKCKGGRCETGKCKIAGPS